MTDKEIDVSLSVAGQDGPAGYRHIRSRLAATSVVPLGFLVGRFGSCTRSRQPRPSNQSTTPSGINRLREAYTCRSPVLLCA